MNKFMRFRSITRKPSLARIVPQPFPTSPDTVKTLLLIALSLVLAPAGISTASAQTIYDRGSYTVNTTTTGSWADGTGVGFNGWEVGFGFSENGRPVGSLLPAVAPDVLRATASGTLTAQFQASPGRIFDRLELTRPVGDGIMAVYWGGYAESELFWTVNGGPFVGGTTFGSTWHGIYREWAITGPSTGRNYSYGFRNAFTSDGGLTTSGYYDIGASSFSMDISGIGRGFGDGGLTAPGAAFTVSMIDAPVAAIPEPETYAMLLAGLGLLGFMARRRKQKGLLPLN